METVTKLSGKKPPPLRLIRAGSQKSMVLDAAATSPVGPATPPLRPPGAVPFLWEEAPGKPKPSKVTCVEGASSAGKGDDDHDGGFRPRPVPLKLPPRLLSTVAEAGSPRTVLQGPYGGPRPARASRKLITGRGLFSWMKTVDQDNNTAAASASPPLDASSCSPAASSLSSLSLSSCSGDDHEHGAKKLQLDGRHDSSAAAEKGTVRIRRLRRHRSVSSVVSHATTSQVWASIRKHVKQITPWS